MNQVRMRLKVPPGPWLDVESPETVLKTADILRYVQDAFALQSPNDGVIGAEPPSLQLGEGA
jgi:hypothetical protein